MMVTIHVCPGCGKQLIVESGEGSPHCAGFMSPGGRHEPVEMRPVRFFSEDVVRPLWEAAPSMTIVTPGTQGVFPAPPDWGQPRPPSPPVA
jgi:hypothetical protein